MLLRVLNGALLKSSKELYSYVDKNIDAYVFIGAPKLPLYRVSTTLKNFFIVTSKYDDVYVTKTARNTGVLLDARVISLSNYLIAGVGGIDPWYAIMRLRELLGNQTRSKILLFSYFPAYGVCDYLPELSVKSGLAELRNFLDHIKPYVFISLGSVECGTRYGETNVYTLSRETPFLDLKLGL
ncbi:MAG: hypothetical protein ACP5KB_00670 [Thermoprotei archaeon]